VRFQVLTAASMMFRAVFWVDIECLDCLCGSLINNICYMKLEVFFNTYQLLREYRITWTYAVKYQLFVG
jgi:hypothetical protein